MTSKTKAFYDTLIIGQWMERTSVEYYGSQLAITLLHRANLIELKFSNGIQFIRRKPTSELMA